MIKTPLSTVIGGAFWTPSCTVIGGQQSFSQLIKKLFANNEQGFAYDPNDLSTMYQDAAGTVPVTTVGQPVGLMLDKSKGLVLSSELASVTEVVSLPIDGVVGVKTYHIGTVAIGKTHQISFTVTNYTGSGDVGIAGPATHWADGTAVNTASNGTKTCIRTNIGTGSINLYTRNTAACVFSNISIKELKGNHAYQTTSAARPILRDTPRRIDFDAVDDKLITNLPAQLSGCTVIRSVPNVGTQILTGQTIPATYEDNKDHCGLIVINRALTATETSQITKLFNKAAGV